MKLRYNKGGMETVIAMVIIVGLVAAILVAVVVPMARQGEDLIGTTTNELADQQVTLGPR